MKPKHAGTAESDRAVRAAARGIAAGLPLDWGTLESSALSDSARAIFRQLRVVADIADVHRSVADPAASVWDTANERAGTDAPAGDDTYGGLPTWGSLTLLERVGEGSFGEVYRAWDGRLDREVALKLLSTQAAQSGTVERTVIDEGRLLARVRHPNVVTVYGADLVEARVGLWMEFVRGRTLEHVLRQTGTMSAQEAAAIGLDLCRALSAVHHAGLVHRDVKAQNVMREAGGRIVLMDFGTGEMLLENGEQSSIAGTPLYLAPEILRRERITPAADLYSLGVMLFHLVSGAYPVTGRSLVDIRDAHRRGHRTYLRDLRPDLPVRFVDVIERSLSADVAARFESAGMMERALADALLGDRVADAAPAAPKARRRQARRWLVGALVATGVAILPLVKWLPSRQRAAEGPGVVGAPGSGPVIRQVPLPRRIYVGRPAPNGRQIPYVDADGDVAVLDPASGSSRKLTNKGEIDEAGEMASAISADGTQIAYTWRTLDNRFQLRVVNMDGKWPRVLDIADAYAAHPIQWSRDGRRILSLIERSDRTMQLAMIDASSGAMTIVRNFGHGSPQHASLSPDGRYVAYDRPEHDMSAARDVFVASANGGGDEVPIVRHAGLDASPMWTGDGTGVVFFSERTGALGAWFQPIANGKASGQPRVVDKEVGRVRPLALTDAGTLYYLKATSMVDVYVAPLDADITPGDARVIAPNFVGDNVSSGFSRDGRYVAWISLRGLPGERFSRVLSIRDFITGAERLLTPALGFFSDLRWSPDGRFVLVRGIDLERRQGWHTIDVTTGAVTPAILGHDNDVGNATWSADGTAVLYGRRNTAIVSRNLKTGAEHIEFDGAPEGLTIGRGNFQTFGVSPDGRAIAFRVVKPSDISGAPGIGTLRVKFFDGRGADLVTADPKEGIEFQDWTPDSRGVLFVRFTQADRQKRTLWRATIDGHEPRSLGLTMTALREFRVRRDGRLATFTAGVANEAELWSAENFVKR